MPVQTKIIDNVNRVLRNNDAAVQLDKAGVCGGLASMYVRYSLEGRKKEFFELSKKLAYLNAEYRLGQDDALDKFISEIETEFNRQDYSKGQYYQGDMENVYLSGKPIKKEYSIGLVTYKVSWAELLKQMHNEGRACYVRSHNHAVAISFVDNEYEVFDPNYDEDSNETPKAKQENTRRFKTAQEVINELAVCFSYPETSPVGLGIIVYAHPDEKVKPSYPEKEQLFQDHLNQPIDLQTKVEIDDKDWSYNSLFFATNINDQDTIKYYAKRGEISLTDCSYLMYMHNNNELVFDRYTQEKNQKNKSTLIDYAMWAGNKELFTRMSTDYQKNYVKTPQEKVQFSAFIKSSLSLERASRAKNPTCLPLVIELHRQYKITFDAINKKESITIIENLTKNGDKELLKCLVDELSSLSPEVIEKGIKTAILHEKNSALQFWLDQWEKKKPAHSDTLIDKEVIKKVSLIHFRKLIGAGFTVNSSLYAETLKRNNPEFFELSIKSKPDSQWNEFLNKNKANTLKSPIDLFRKEAGLTAFQVLVRYKNNQLIETNWSNHLSQLEGNEALAFACECANKETVAFLARKGFKLDAKLQKEQLETAIKSDEHDKIDAILSGIIDPQLFAQSNKQLINDLIGMGKSQFIIKSWSDYKKATATQADFIPIDDLLWVAVTKNNKELYEFIAEKETIETGSLIKLLLSSQSSLVCTCAIRLCGALKPKEFHEFLRTELKPFEDRVFNRETREQDEAVDREFLHNARQLVQPLANLLIYAIKNHYFSFAEKTLSQVSLSKTELYDLFVTAHQDKDEKAIQFLIRHYSYLSQNEEVYFKLAEEQNFTLLAFLLEQNIPLKEDACSKLLTSAIKVANEPVIQILAPYINTYYRMHSAPLYKALAENNIEGSILLLKYGALIPNSIFFQKLFDVAVRHSTDSLLEQAFHNATFVDHFEANLQENLAFIFKSGSSDVVLALYKKLSSAENGVAYELMQRSGTFNDFLNHAIETDNVPLFNILKENNKGAPFELNELFEVACTKQALGIVNELLSSSLVKPDQSKLNQLLDLLFAGVEQNKNNETYAHALYDVIYQKKLNRLYEFVVNSKYRPFAAIYKNISEIIDDPGLAKVKASKLKNKLIERALEEDDPESLRSLLNQVSSLPPLDKTGLDLFALIQDKPLVLNVLLEHYSYDEVLEKAEELGYWLVVAGLLRGRLVSDVNPEIISRLRKHAKDIFEAMVEHAKKRLHDDPRMELNQLLITEPHLALNDILRDQKSTIEKTIMEVQDLMEKEQIDLNRRIYRFDLQNEMLNTQKIIDELSPLIEAFFKEHQKQSPQELIDNEMTRQQILEFKKAIETHDLHPSYFEHKTQLESVFDLATVFEQQHEGTRFESDQHQEEQDIFYDASDSFASESSTIEQQETHNSFYGALDSLASKRSTLEQENALSMNDDGDPYQEDQHDKFYDVSDTADHFEEVEIVQPQPSSPVIDNADNSPEELNKFQGLIDEINRYKKLRESEGHTHFVVPLFQYTKLDKMNAADHLIAALKNKDRVINDRDRAVLNNGLLSTAITSFLRKNKITITDGKPIKSVNELVNQLNQRQQPVGLLIKLLEDYRTQRKAKSEKYHFSFFPQYSKSDKLIAIDHFIAGLNGSEDDVEAKDIKALKQGSLGKLINNFLSANADALTKHFGKPITDIDDLITACSEKNRPSIN